MVGLRPDRESGPASFSLLQKQEGGVTCDGLRPLLVSAAYGLVNALFEQGIRIELCVAVAALQACRAIECLRSVLAEWMTAMPANRGVLRPYLVSGAVDV